MVSTAIAHSLKNEIYSRDKLLISSRIKVKFPLFVHAIIYYQIHTEYGGKKNRHLIRLSASVRIKMEITDVTMKL